MAEYPPEISPAKRRKTLTSDSLSPSPSSSSSKGKSIKNEEDDDNDLSSENQLDTCGVCLLEEGMSIRGFIDSCNHYFCFVCIMEWAKVESRCPICKRRFSTIRRPAKAGVFPSDRIVNVPVRDQIYCYNGNATIGPSNPYSEVKCSVCSGGDDESLLLLCDLCDSAAHSYCVGLGATVPEGDWFCQDCTISRAEHTKSETDVNCDRAEHTKSETDVNCDSHTGPSTSDTVQTTEANVSIFDIVREPSILRPRRHSIAPSCPNQSPETTRPVVGCTSSARTPETTQPVVGCASSARTLQRCLNVHARIIVMRENWDGFRRGSFRFPAQQQPSCSNQKSTVQKDSCTDVSPNGGSYDVDRAWKMMDVAVKAIGRKSGKKGIIEASKKGDLLKEAGMGSKLLRFESLKKNYSVGTSENNDNKDRFQMLEKHKGRQGPKGMKNNVEGSRIDSLGHRELAHHRKVDVSAQVHNYHKNGENVPRKGILGARLNAASDSDGSFHFSRSPKIATEKYCTKQKLHVPLKEKDYVKNVPDHDGKIRNVNDAKSEIQSLVKLNLKLLSRTKKLEVDVFKEVARHATHSILAACGFEQPKTGFRTCTRTVCKHVDETQKRPRSTLMPTSCRECFFVFVRDVVNTIVSDRTGPS